MKSDDTWIIQNDVLLTTPKPVPIADLKQKNHAAAFFAPNRGTTLLNQMRGRKDDGYPLKIIVPEETNQITFSLAQIIPSDGRKEILLPVTLQKPIVNSPFNALVVNMPSWGAKFVNNVPLLTDMDIEKTLNFALEFQCLKKGKHTVSLSLNLSPTQSMEKFELSRMRNSKDKLSYSMSVSFTKMCGEAQQSSVSHGLPGFYISSSIEANRRDVIVNGEATPTFKLDALPGDQQTTTVTAGPIGLYVVEEGITTHTFGVEYNAVPGGKRYLDIASATAISANPNVQVSIVGHAARRHRVISYDAMSKLSVHMLCKDRVDAIITVVINIHQNTASPRFSFLKRCGSQDLIAAAGITKCDGGVCQLSIGTDTKTTDVIYNGIITRSYLPTETEDGIQRRIFSEDTSSTTFYINIRGEPLFNIDGLDAVSQEPDIMVAKVEDVYKYTAIKINKDTPELTFTVSYTCLKSGTASVTVFVHTEEVVSFTYSKVCIVSEPELPLPVSGNTPTEPVSATDVANFFEPKTPIVPQPNVIPGLAIALTTAPDTISAVAVSHGITQPDYCPWTAKQPLVVNSATQFVTFFALVMRPNNEAEQSSFNDVRFTYPLVSVFTQHIADVRVTGQGSNGALLSPSDDTYSVLSLSLHCKQRGSTWIKVSLPIVSKYEEEYSLIANGVPVRPRAYRDEQHIEFHFKKECFLASEDGTGLDKAVVSSSALGGVGMQGLSIGFKPRTATIVRDGFPLPEYYGQRNLNSPDWKNIIINEDTHVVSIYLSYFLARYERSHDDLLIPNSVTLGTPAVVSHNAAASPELSGVAAMGTTLQFGGPDSELILTFNCNFKDLVPVTITIPVEPTGSIVFTIPKQCGGKTIERGTQVPGLQLALVQEMCIEVSGDASQTPTQTGMKEDGSGIIVRGNKVCKLAPRPIMKDGIADEEFSIFTSPTAPHYVVPGTESMTSFVIRRATSVERKHHPIFGTEPIVQCLRPICRPKLTHTLHLDVSQYSNTDGSGNSKQEPKYNGFPIPEPILEPNTSPVVIADKLRRINITYHCLYPGITPVQLTIPVYPDSAISILYIKKCSGDSLKDTIDTQGSVGQLTSGWERHDETSGTVDPLALNPFLTKESKSKVAGLNPSDIYRTALMGTLDITNVNPKLHPEAMANVVYQGVPRKAYRVSSAQEESELEEDEPVKYKQVEKAKYLLSLEEAAGKKVVKQDVHANEKYYSWSYWASWLLKPGQQRFGEDTLLSAEELDLLTDIDPERKYALIPPSMSKTRFYLTVNPDEPSFQPFASPFVKTLANSLGQQIVSAVVTGPVRHGANITSIVKDGKAPKIEGSPLVQVLNNEAYIDVEFKCLREGYTSALVVVPLIPSVLGSVSWRVIKLCSGVRAAKSWLTIIKVLYISILALPLLLLVIYQVYKGTWFAKLKERYEDWKYGDTTWLEQLQSTTNYQGINSTEYTDTDVPSDIETSMSSGTTPSNVITNSDVSDIESSNSSSKRVTFGNVETLDMNTSTKTTNSNTNTNTNTNTIDLSLQPTNTEDEQVQTSTIHVVTSDDFSE